MSQASPQVHVRYRFADFEVREDSGELRHRDESLRLPDQAWDVLLALLRASGRLVTREDLRQQLWPNRAFGDFDGGLNAAVCKLRRALQDDGAEPHLIGTLPKHGYRMLVPVQILEEDRPGPPGATTAVHPSARLSLAGSMRWLFAILLVAGGLGVWGLLAGNGRHAGAGRVPSIALLPLANVSGDPAQEFLAVSLTEHLIQELALRRDIQVAPFAAVHSLRQEQILPAELCHRLGVEAFVEGSVRREGDRLFLHLRLVPGRSGLAAWAQNLDMPWKDLSEIPSVGAAHLVRAMELPSIPREASGGSRDAEATAAYWEARYELSLLNSGGIEKAIALYERATLRDPRFASAYGGLANAELWRGLLNRQETHSALMASYRYAIRALELDPSCGEAHLALAFIHWLHDWDFPAAEARFQKALEVTPGSAQIHAAYASYLFFRGRDSEAEPHLALGEPSAKGDPIVAMDVLRCYTLSKRHQEVIEFGRSLLADRPHWTWAHGHLFEACVATGRVREAIDENLNAVADLPELAKNLEGLRGGRDLRTMLRREATWNETRHSEGKTFEGPGVVAYLWASLGERDSALRWLEAAVEAKDYDALFVLRYPYWDAFKGEPRFEKLLLRMGTQKDVRSAKALAGRFTPASEPPASAPVAP